MNELAFVLIFVFVVIGSMGTMGTEEAIKLDSLCVVDGGVCKRSSVVEPKTPDQMQGMMCLSESDLKKIVEKLKSVQDGK